MFSFAGDTILDPFVGTGTTTIAAIQQGRHSIGNEVDDAYFDLTIRNVKASAKERSFSGPKHIDVEIVDGSGRMAEVGIRTAGRI
jgi:site-specific DNA-methyltransferase (adenine-specific)